MTAKKMAPVFWSHFQKLLRRTATYHGESILAKGRRKSKGGTGKI
jgi:hypothetical protein